MSIYYCAKREHPLTGEELTTLKSIISRFSRQAEIERYDSKRRGMNWEDFYVYEHEENNEEKIVFNGATKLPDNKIFAPYKGTKHWAACLTEIRRQLLPDATWHVHIDDKMLEWSDAHGWHDNASDGFASLWLGCALTAPFRLLGCA